MFFSKFINTFYDINFLVGLIMEDAQIQNICLLQVEDLLISNDKSLKDFSSTTTYSFRFLFMRINNY